MQATSSQVISTGATAQSLLMMGLMDDDPGTLILSDLQKSARASGRDHLLVRRRRRDTRRNSR